MSDMLSVGPAEVVVAVARGASVAGPSASVSLRVSVGGSDEVAASVVGVGSCCWCTASLNSSFTVLGEAGRSLISTGFSVDVWVGAACDVVSVEGAVAPATASACDAIVGG